MTAILLLAFSAFLPAQTDPLSSTYQPAIDTNAADYPANIWITDTMQKVRQDSGSPGAQHWGTFYGTQNEFVDFQVHFHDTGSGTSNLSVTVSNFVQTAPTSYTISAASTNIVVYREAYIDITRASSTASAYYGTTGYYPDALIPAVDPYYHQTTNAFPVNVAASQNQSAWVDVHIPPAAPAGYYLGSVTVKSGSSTLATMPVIIGVWQWPSAGHMPSTSSLPTDYSLGWADFCVAVYGSEAACSAYPGSQDAESGAVLSDIAGAALMLDHRVSMLDPVTYYNYTNQSYYNLFAGGGSPTTILSGAHPTGVNAVASGGETLQGWATLWANNASAWAPAFTYDYCPSGCDEPHTAAQWSTIVSSANAAHAVSPPLPIVVDSWWESLTGAQTSMNTYGDVSGYVDTLVVDVVCMEPLAWQCANQTGSAGALQRSKYNTWLSGQSTLSGVSTGITRQLGSYLACNSGGTCSNSTMGSNPYNYPAYAVDATPAVNRAQEWMTFFHQQTFELYYYTTCSWETPCWQGTPGSNNPWTNQLTFGNNGDGTLLYPSTFNGINYVTQQGGSALTTPLWLPSIRVKHIRDGMQDYEYLNVLTNQGQGTVVNKQITSWITNSYTYDFSGAGLQAARSALGTAMHKLTYATILPPTTVKSSAVQVTK
jgi:hypothetical protein